MGFAAQAMQCYILDRTHDVWTGPVISPDHRIEKAFTWGMQTPRLVSEYHTWTTGAELVLLQCGLCLVYITHNLIYACLLAIRRIRQEEKGY